MSPNPNAPTPASSAPGGEYSSVRDTAVQQSRQVKDQAQGAARDVAGTAKDEARNLKDEATGQAKDLAGSAKQEAASQLSTQKDRLATQSRTISEDLERISRGERPESDLVNQAVSMLSQRARRITEQLETKEPMDLLDDVRRFAARRPGTFLAIAAGVGLAAGRLTRGLKDAHDDGDSRHRSTSARHAAPSSPEPIDRVPGTVYPEDPDYPKGDLGTGSPAAEVLGTPATPGPSGTGLPSTGDRP